MVYRQTKPKSPNTSKSLRRSSMCMMLSSASRNTWLATYVDGRPAVLIYRSLMTSQNVTLADLQHLPYGSLVVAGGHADVFEKRSNVARCGTCVLIMQLMLTWGSILGGGRISPAGLLGMLSRTGLRVVNIGEMRCIKEFWSTVVYAILSCTYIRCSCARGRQYTVLESLTVCGAALVPLDRPIKGSPNSNPGTGINDYTTETERLKSAGY